MKISAGLVSVAVFYLAALAVKLFIKHDMPVFFAFFWATILSGMALSGIKWSGKHSQRKAS